MRWRTKDSTLIAYLGYWEGDRKRLYLFKTKNGRYFLQEESGTDFARIWTLNYGEAVQRFGWVKKRKDAVALMSFEEAFPDGIEDA